MSSFDPRHTITIRDIRAANALLIARRAATGSTHPARSERRWWHSLRFSSDAINAAGRIAFAVVRQA